MIPRQGDIWWCNFSPRFVEPEIIGESPSIVISNDDFNDADLGVVIVIPLSMRDIQAPMIVEISKDDATGLKRNVYAWCHLIRSLSVQRLHKKIGGIRSTRVIRQIKDVIQYLL